MPPYKNSLVPGFVTFIQSNFSPNWYGQEKPKIMLVLQDFFMEVTATR